MVERRRSGRGLKVAVIILGTLVALGFVVLIAGRLFLDDARVQTLAEREVGEALAGDVEIGAFHWDRFPTRGVAENLVLRDMQGRAVLEVTRAHIQIDPGGLLRRAVRITRLDAEGVTVRLIPAEPAGFTLAEALASPDAPVTPVDPADPAWRVIARNVNVAGGRFEMETGNEDLVIEGLDVSDASLRWADGGLRIQADARAADLSFHSEAMAVRASSVDAAGLRLAWGPDPERATVTAERIETEVDGSPVALSGGLEGLAAAAALGFDLNVEADLDLTSPDVYATLPEAVRAQVAPRGEVRVSARIRGTVDAPDVTGEIAGRRMRVADIDAARIEAKGRYVDEQLTVERLFMDLDPGTLLIEGEVDLGEVLPAWRARATLDGVQIGRMASAYVDPELMPRRVDGEIVASGEGLEAPTGHVSADLVVAGLPPALVAEIPPELASALPDRVTLVAETTLAETAVDVTRLRLESEGLTFTAHGRVPLHESPFQSTAEGRLELEGFAYDDIPVADIDADLRFAGGVLHLEPARILTASGRIDASGRLTLFDADGTRLDDPLLTALVRGRNIDLANLVDLPVSFEGRLRGEARVVGSLAAPRARGRIAFTGLEVEGVAFTRATATLTADLQAVHLMALNLQPAEGGRIAGTGVLDLPARTFEVDVEGSALPLALVETVVDLPVSVAGALDVQASGHGPLEAPRLGLALQAEAVTLDEIAVGRIRAEAEGDLDRLQAGMVLDGAAGRIVARGAILIAEGRLEGVRLTGDDLVVAALPGVAALPFALSGRASIDLNADGSLPIPELRGRVRVDEFAVNGEQVHRGRFLLQVGPLDDEAHAVGVGVPGALWVRARIVPGPPLLVEATADVEDFELAWLLPALREAEVDARLVGEGAFRYRHDPARVEARLRLPELEIDVAGETLRSRRPISMHYDGDTLTLDRLELEGPLGVFVAGGTLGERLDFMARGRLEMAVLALFVPEIARARGALAVDLRAGGTLDTPELAGTLGVAEPLRFLPRGMLREIAITDLRARLEPGHIILDGLAGEVVGGAFRAAGEAQIDGLALETFVATFRGQGLPLRAEGLVAEVDVDLRLTGAGGRGTIAGTADLVRGRYRRTFALDAFALIAPDEAPAPAREPIALLEQIDLDLRVTSVGAVNARAEAGALALDMVLDADLQVTGTAAVPWIEGRISASRGHVEMPQTRLEVVRGAVDFAPVPGDPMRAVIDVLAEGEVIVPPGATGMIEPTYFVSVGLEGSLEEMTIDLTSQPALDRLEVLALLVTGRVAPAEISPGDGRHVESAMIFAGTRLAEPLTRAITERLEEVLNLDLFVAEVTAEGITITAGTEVSRRLSLEGAFQQGFGDAGAMATARAQFLLSNMVFLEGTAESVAEQGAPRASPVQEGTRGRLEIKARILGGG